MNIQRVDVGHVHQVWPMVETHLAAALEFAKGDYTLESVKVMLVTGQWLLLVAVDDEGLKGAATVVFSSRPHDRVAFVTLIGGKLISNEDTFEQLKTFCVLWVQRASRVQHVTLLRVCGRDMALKKSTKLLG